MIIIFFLEKLKDLKNVLAREISSPLKMAKYLYNIGVFSKYSYLAVTNSFIRISGYRERKYPLVNLLFDELVDPTIFDIFKDFCRLKLPKSYKVLNSMGEY